MKTVLIIDDDAEYRELIGKILQHNGWDTLQADNGDDGVKLAKARRPDVVLCDLLMPRGNGFQVCRSLRGEPSLRQTRIVVTSGRDFESDRQSAFSAGADEYVTKPINPSQLVVLLARLAEQSKSSRESFQTAAPFAGGATRLKFWGVRGSIPTPGPTTVHYGGNTSCVEVRADGQIIILDAGTGLRLLGRQLTEDFDPQPMELTLLLTHTHWDHIQGLPFFLPVYKSQNHLRVLGYEGARHGLDSVLTGQMESPFFPLSLREVPANVEIEELKEMNFSIGPVRVEACFANHPGICVGYRLFTSSGSIAFFPDHETRSADSSAAAEEGSTIHDGDQDRKMIDFLRGTDVLIMDTQYDRSEYRRYVGWGHGCVDDVVALALRADVKRLFLFHHDPDHDDAKVTQMVEHARELADEEDSTLQIEAAREGATVELKPASRAKAVSQPVA
jgi:phosphoribosyl 1,2-cyclic phosphodiesterase/CheY-like chemotaxis protein